MYSLGVGTNRDAWVYNFSNQSVTNNMARMIDFYNEQVKQSKNCLENKDQKIETFISNDPRKISWSESLKKYLERGLIFELNENSLVK